MIGKMCTSTFIHAHVHECMYLQLQACVYSCMYSLALLSTKPRSKVTPEAMTTPNTQISPFPTKRNQDSLQKWLIRGWVRCRYKTHRKCHIIPKRNKMTKKKIGKGRSKGHMGARLKGLPLAKSRTTSTREWLCTQCTIKH